MIARIWRGAVRAGDATAYADYIQQTGIEEYRKTPGNLGAWLLWRVAGEQAVFYPEDDRFLVERDLTAHHYEVAGPE
jgi:hypothetical protein